MEWGDLRVFLHVARAGQMAGASRELGLDHSTISRRISRLEEKTGVLLFERAGRRLSLTEEGRKLLCAAERLESIIIKDVMILGESQQLIAGKVRIGAPEGIGAHYLARLVPAILEVHPQLEVELVALPRQYSLGMRDVDLAISLDRPASGDIRFKKLSDATFGVYGSQSYFLRKSRPETLADLNDHLWCGYIDELRYSEELDMLHFGDVHIKPRYRTTNIAVQINAAVSGAVLAVLPCYIATQFPVLEAVIPDQTTFTLTYWLSVHGDLADSPRVRAVMNAIECQVALDKKLFMQKPGAPMLIAEEV